MYQSATPDKRAEQDNFPVEFFCHAADAQGQVDMSIITDLGIRDEENKISHEEVLREAGLAEPRLTAIFKGLVAAL